MTRAQSHQCRLANCQVTITHQTSLVSGIGASGSVKQRDFGCSRQFDCRYRDDKKCAVRQLNR